MSLIERSFREKIVLVGVTLPRGDHGWEGHPPEVETERHLDELALLVGTAGADVVAPSSSAAPAGPGHIHWARQGARRTGRVGIDRRRHGGVRRRAVARSVPQPGEDPG